MSSLDNTDICELYRSLIDNKQITDIYDIVLWDNLSSIYLSYKVNSKDGHIITTMPYIDNGIAVRKLIAIIVDEYKIQKSGMYRFIDRNLESYLLKTFYC